MDVKYLWHQHLYNNDRYFCYFESGNSKHVGPAMTCLSLHMYTAWSVFAALYMSHDTTKCVFGSFQPGQTQTGLRNHRS